MSFWVELASIWSHISAEKAIERVCHPIAVIRHSLFSYYLSSNGRAPVINAIMTFGRDGLRAREERFSQRIATHKTQHATNNNTLIIGRIRRCVGDGLKGSSTTALHRGSAQWSNYYSSLSVRSLKHNKPKNRAQSSGVYHPNSTLAVQQS